MDFEVKKIEDMTALELLEIIKLRVSVFVVEQKCPYMEVDDFDKDSFHILLKDGKEVLAYARLLPKGLSFESVSIGRVIAVKRRQGFGSMVVKKAMDLAKEKLGAEKIEIEAQLYVKSMYEKLGFRVSSDEFLEDGIAHVRMTYGKD